MKFDEEGRLVKGWNYAHIIIMVFAIAVFLIFSIVSINSGWLGFLLMLPFVVIMVIQLRPGWNVANEYQEVMK